MSHSATIYVDVSVDLAATGPEAAAFGVPVQIFESTVSPASRMHGPFLSAADVVDFGYTDGSPPHVWAQTLMSQQPRVRRFYIGARRAADADDGVAFNAILAASPGTGYIYNSALRDSAEALALAAAVEAAAYPKIAIVQSSEPSLLDGGGPGYVSTIGGTVDDGDIDLLFTGFGLGAPVTVTATRAAGTPATLALLLEALHDELETAAGVAGDLEGVVDPDSLVLTPTTLSYRIIDGLASGTVTPTADSTMTLDAVSDDLDLGSRMFALQYTRTGVMYYSDDAVYADGALTSRCGSFDLDTRKGIWAFKRLVGVTGDELSNLEVSNLRAVNANYFGPATAASGVTTQAFTAQGWMPSGLTGAGRRIDVTTSLDWARARLEEALLGVLLASTHGEPSTPAGVNLFTAAAARVLRQGVNARHFMDFVIPEDEEGAGTVTPVVFAPDVRTMTATQRASRELTFSAIAYLAPFAERVVFNLSVRQ